jgi:uncharacterized membrane protein
MKLKTLTYATVTFVTVSVVAGAVLYPRLPDPVPTHFGLRAEPDGYTAKPLGVFLTPIAILALGLFFAALPRISPKQYRIDRFLKVYEIMAVAVLAAEFADGLLGLHIALGHPMDRSRAGVVTLGFLMVVLGNFLGKVTRNFFVGIRTPWTLANPEVWLRTHRLGGVAFVAGGAVILIAGFTGAGTPLLAIGVTVTLALFLIVYSFVIYRQLEGSHRAPRRR